VVELLIRAQPLHVPIDFKQNIKLPRLQRVPHASVTLHAHSHLAVTRGDISRAYPAKRQLCHVDDAMMASPLPALPDDYNELLHTAIHTTCSRCGDTPKKPAQCLVCGALVCPKAKCCADQGRGECTQHADRCDVQMGNVRWNIHVIFANTHERHGRHFFL
jgi:hypothetical protein